MIVTKRRLISPPPSPLRLAWGCVVFVVFTAARLDAGWTEAGTERRKLESSALTARKALFDARRGWGAEKDTLLAAVREAGQRAELAAGEATEAKVLVGGG